MRSEAKRRGGAQPLLVNTSRILQGVSSTAASENLCAHMEMKPPSLSTRSCARSPQSCVAYCGCRWCTTFCCSFGMGVIRVVSGFCPEAFSRGLFWFRFATSTARCVALRDGALGEPILVVRVRLLRVVG